MTTAKAVLDRARSQLGVNESPPGSNRTPYGVWYGLDGVPWCGIFLSWCFYMAGLPLPASNPKGFAYTPSGAAWFQSRGKWSHTPKPGYVVFFDWPDDGVNRISHVGLVESVKADGMIVTIEGNTNNMVMRHNRQIGMVGYGIPDYENEAPADDWFAKATEADLKQVVHRVLAEGTSLGQTSWAGTSQATLRTSQQLYNLITQKVLSKLDPRA